MDRELERNKAVVTDFYRTAFVEHRPKEAASKHLGRAYRQHHPGAGDGAEAFVDFVSTFAKANPGLTIDLKRVVAEGDLVVTHSNMKLHPQDRGFAVMDIFRLADGKIVEHWDVMQPVPETSANKNTMF